MLKQFLNCRSRVLVAVLLLAIPLSAQPLPQNSTQPPTPGGVTVDPSAAPLQPGRDSQPQAAQPNPAPLPQAPTPVSPAPQQPQPKQPVSVPLGAAAAEQVQTAGGGASRPGGNAIAPMQQHRYRSLIIKLGAIAAAGIAIGTVTALSRSTPSVPPHSASAASPPR